MADTPPEDQPDGLDVAGLFDLAAGSLSAATDHLSMAGRFLPAITHETATITAERALVAAQCATAHAVIGLGAEVALARHAPMVEYAAADLDVVLPRSDGDDATHVADDGGLVFTRGDHLTDDDRGRIFTAYGIRERHRQDALADDLARVDELLGLVREHPGSVVSAYVPELLALRSGYVAWWAQ